MMMPLRDSLHYERWVPSSRSLGAGAAAHPGDGITDYWRGTLVVLTNSAQGLQGWQFDKRPNLGHV